MSKRGSVSYSNYELVPYMEPKEGCFSNALRVLSIFSWAISFEEVAGNLLYAGKLSTAAAQVCLPDYGQFSYVARCLKSHGICSWCFIPALRQGQDAILFIRMSDAEKARRVVGYENVIEPSGFNILSTSLMTGGLVDFLFFLGMTFLEDNGAAGRFVDYQVVLLQAIYEVLKVFVEAAIALAT